MNQEKKRSRSEIIRFVAETAAGVLFWVSLLFGVGAVGTLEFEGGDGVISKELIDREVTKSLVSGIMMVISFVVCFKCGTYEEETQEDETDV